MRNLTAWSRATLAVIAAVVVSGCSVVFDAGLSGTVADLDRYDENPDAAGIDGVEVYLYLNVGGQERDLNRYGEDGLLPDESGDDRYFLKTVTATNASGGAGAFSFSNIFWHSLLPRFGRSGDRREIFFLLHHPDYGMHARSAFVVSDTTNRLAPLKIQTILTSATIAGELVDAATDASVSGATVQVFAPDGYTTDAGFTYPITPTGEFTTTLDGGYGGSVEFSRDLAAEPGYVELLLLFDHDDYVASASADSQLSADRDVDGDGANDTYFRTAAIEEGADVDLPTIGLRRTAFTETLYVFVGTDENADDAVTADEGTNGATVLLYVDRQTVPAADEEADFRSTTTLRLVGGEVQPGWATFTGVSWTDTDYSGAQSSIACYVDIDVDADGTVETTPASGEPIEADNIAVTVTSDADNVVDYEYELQP